jgi:hypothetical protein
MRQLPPIPGLWPASATHGLLGQARWHDVLRLADFLDNAGETVVAESLRERESRRRALRSRELVRAGRPGAGGAGAARVHQALAAAGSAWSRMQQHWHDDMAGHFGRLHWTPLVVHGTAEYCRAGNRVLTTTPADGRFTNIGRR